MIFIGSKLAVLPVVEDERDELVVEREEDESGVALLEVLSVVCAELVIGNCVVDSRALVTGTDVSVVT